MKKIVSDSFYNEFTVNQYVSKDELYQYLINFYEKMGQTTLNWRIYDLIHDGYIIKLSANRFKITDNKTNKPFSLDIPPKLNDILKEYNSKMVRYRIMSSDINVYISVFDTSILNKFTNHQTFSNYILIEIDKSRMNQLFIKLKENFIKTTLLISKKTPLFLIEDSDILIASLPLKAPLMGKITTLNNYVCTPKLEKILVDVVVYSEYVLPYDMSEIINIYKGAYKTYNIKTKTVLNYARIRGYKTRSKVELILRRIGEIE